MESQHAPPRDVAVPSERQQLELLTRRLVAAVVERASCALMIEAHGGGGQYDEIRLYVEDPEVEQDTPWISINRLGSVHVLRGSTVESRPMLEAMQRGLRTEDAASWLTTRFARSGGATTSPALIHSSRLMSRVIDQLVGAAPTVEWQWRMAFLDSSGGDSGVREEWLESVPRALLEIFDPRPATSA